MCKSFDVFIYIDVGKGLKCFVIMSIVDTMACWRGGIEGLRCFRHGLGGASLTDLLKISREIKQGHNE